MSKLAQRITTVLGTLAMVSLMTAAGFYLLAAIDRTLLLMGTPGWTFLDWAGAILTAFAVGFILLSSVLAFLAAVIEGRKLSRKKP